MKKNKQSGNPRFLDSKLLILEWSYLGFNYYSEKAEMEKALEYSADATAHRLAIHLREPFWALNDNNLKEALMSEMLDKQIFAINVLVVFPILSPTKDKNCMIFLTRWPIPGGYFFIIKQSIRKTPNGANCLI